MVSSGRHEELFHGYKIIVHLWQGKLQGRAYFGVSDCSKEKMLETTGNSPEEILAELHNMVDERNRIEGLDASNLHLNYLASVGKPDHGRSSTEIPRSPPQWHCYNCGSRFDSFMGLLCLGCRTESCPNCGACHCGYHYY